MARGVVKWFHPIMGYGIIAPDDGSAVVRVDPTAAEAGRLGQIKKGVRLEYDLVRIASGGWRAANLRVASLRTEPAVAAEHGLSAHGGA